MSAFKVQISPEVISRLSAIAEHNGALSANAVLSMVATTLSKTDPAKLHEILGVIAGYTAPKSPK